MAAIIWSAKLKTRIALEVEHRLPVVTPSELKFELSIWLSANY